MDLWDCPRCGQDPEDCYCEGPYLDPKPWRCTLCSDRFATERYKSGAERTTHRVEFSPRAIYEQDREAYRGN